MIKCIDSKALRLAAQAGTKGIEEIESMAKEDKEKSFMVSCLYSDYMDSFWHYIAHYYGKEG